MILEMLAQNVKIFFKNKRKSIDNFLAATFQMILMLLVHKKQLIKLFIVQNQEFVA